MVPRSAGERNQVSSGVQSKGEKAVIGAWVAGRCNIDNLNWCAAHDNPVCGVVMHWGAAQNRTGVQFVCEKQGVLSV